MKEYFAHSPKNGYPAQTYAEHVQNVTRLAKAYARQVCPYGPKDGEALAMLAGTAAFWHDLGKLDTENQAVLSGERAAKALPVHHWDAGAAFLAAQSPYAAAAVYSHHNGYPDFATESKREQRAFRDEREIDKTDNQLSKFVSLQKTLLGAAGQKTEKVDFLPKGDRSTFLRLLLSCLADADHGDTAEHYGNTAADRPAPTLHPAERLQRLDEYVASLASGCSEQNERGSLRNEMYIHCRDAAVADGMNISACDSPVGSGKTTAVMAHLLTQAQKRGLRHVFVILPFTNIIRQSVDVYREALVLPGENPEEVVAEIHHRADFESEDARRFTALWRAPVIVTTAVAFFETLASDTPAALRRLHELPGSAVFVDEAHAALPVKLLPVAWKWMNVYAEEWSCYWVLASGSLCRFWNIPEIAQGTVAKNVSEIVEDELRRRLSKYEGARIDYQSDLTPKTVDAAIEWINRFPGPRLVIANTVNNAAVLACRYRDHFGRGCVEHLSTALTPLDRDRTLVRVKNRLKDPGDTDWVLIATSCVEAGVNLSFRTGFRELGALTSLLQASGRVNREGQYEDAEMWTFVLSDTDSAGINRNPATKDAAEVLRGYFLSHMAISQELCTNAIADEIKLYGVSGLYKRLLKEERNRGFKAVESKFTVIEADTSLAVIELSMVERIRTGQIDWQELQKNSVQVRRYMLQKLKVPEILDGIFLWDQGYDDFLGYMKGVLT